MTVSVRVQEQSKLQRFKLDLWNIMVNITSKWSGLSFCFKSTHPYVYRLHRGWSKAHAGGRAKTKTRDRYNEMRQAEPKWGLLGPWAGGGRGFKGVWSGPLKTMSALSALKLPQCLILNTRLGWSFIFLVIFACPTNFLHFWMVSPLPHGLLSFHFSLLVLYTFLFFPIVFSLPFISWFPHEHSATTICGRSMMAVSIILFIVTDIFYLFNHPTFVWLGTQGIFRSLRTFPGIVGCLSHNPFHKCFALYL